MRRVVLTAAAAGLLLGCYGRRVNEEPVLRNGDRVAEPEVAVEAERRAAERERERWEERRAETAAGALDGCAPAVCEAIVRGEVAPGMTEEQVLAATGTGELSWSVRRAGEATVMLPRDPAWPPRDAAGDLALVRLRDGRVAEIAYREPVGVRLVRDPADATTEGRAAAVAEMLLREGDDYAAAGDLRRALDRYDRAQVLRPDDPLVDYRIASVLDKQLRPIEALIQYRLFLHRLELERIEARGDAAAKLADAIAQARQRVIILERQTR